MQGIEKKYIFENDRYKQKYIDLIHKYSEKFNIIIIAFCIMDNHAHICLYYTDIQNVSKFMHIINSIYANYYNFWENRVGYVFKNRYYSGQIKDKKQLFNTMVYIHNNPVKAKIVGSMKEWKFSTYGEYINNKIPKETTNLLFETKNYIDDFNLIHNKTIITEVFDVEEENLKEPKEIINEFLREYNISIKLVKKEKNLLYELICKMKKEGKILNKDICKELEIGKNTITRIIKNARI